MKRLLLVLLLCVWSALLPAWGGVVELLQDTPASAAGKLTPKARSRVFPALGALPADTESFFAVAQLGNLISAGSGQFFNNMPGLDLAAELDGFALGMSKAAEADLQRLMPIVRVLETTQSTMAEEWMAKASPEAARAIVAEQRELQYRMGEQLVQATQNFHLAPIYAVLSCKPGGEQLLHQLSMLPLMMPVSSEGALGLLARGSYRGFYLRGDLLDLTAANLAPEHEEQLARNLQNARLYVVTEMLGDKLVLAICSNLDEVKLPRRASQSLLGSPRIAAYDALMQRQAVAAGYSSPAVVNMRETLNFNSFMDFASFARGVFNRLAGDNAAMQAGAAAVEHLLQQVALLTPPQKEAERLMVWRDDALYIQLETDACGYRYMPGVLAHDALSLAADTVFYAESTPMQGMPDADAPAVLQDMQRIRQAYARTLLPQLAEEENLALHDFEQVYPALVKLAGSVQTIYASLGGSTALLLQETPEADKPFAFSLRAEVADSAALQAGTRSLLAAVQELELYPASVVEGAVQVQQQDNVLLLSKGPGLELAAPAGGANVGGGAVFSLNLTALARALQRVQASDSEALIVLASVLEKVEGACRIHEGKLRLLLRVSLAGETP